ncbi:MAG: hypothetical protein ACYDCC_15730 [Actinomycetota bacterium]
MAEDPKFKELDALSSKELHDRALKLAERRLDVRFFWDLLKEIPAAEAAAGNVAEADRDIAYGRTLIADAMESSKGKLADALRPIYIDYLMKRES